LYLKELFKNFGRETAEPKKESQFLSRRAHTINDLESGMHLSLSKKNDIAIYCDYEPTNISNTRNSSFWQWRRVAEWYRYINDPIENKNGHMIT
jgi:hypothetical protein